MMKLIFILLLTSTTLFAAVPKIKVLLDRELKSIKIQGSNVSARFYKLNKRKKYLGKRKIKFNCYSKFNTSKSKPIQIASLKSANGILNWKKEDYRGEFHLVTSPYKNRCDLIHDVSLEDYISSLLNKEMNHKWPMEALKAQAIAARTYAYHKIKTKHVSKKSEL